MKKIFIGCGIVVLLILGIVGFLVYEFGADIRAIQEQAEQAVARINALDAKVPFDPAAQTSLDTDRFTTALEVRADLTDELVRIGEDLEEMKRKEDAGETDLGWMAMGHAIIGSMTNVMPMFADRLEAAPMSWPEFSWHTRLLWSVLYRVDIGMGEPDLEPLRNSYTTFKDRYDELRREEKSLPELRDLLGEFPAPLLASAAAVMATDLQLVRRGLRLPELECRYMMPVNDATELQSLEMSEDTKARIEAEHVEAPAPEPDPVPR